MSCIKVCSKAAFIKIIISKTFNFVEERSKVGRSTHSLRACLKTANKLRWGAWVILLECHGKQYIRTSSVWRGHEPLKPMLAPVHRLISVGFPRIDLFCAATQLVRSFCGCNDVLAGDFLPQHQHKDVKNRAEVVWTSLLMLLSTISTFTLVLV